LLSGLIPLGTAFEKTGAAAYIANHVLAFTGVPSPMVVMAVVAVLTSFFSLVASNVGGTVLMIPLAMNLAADAGTNPVAAAVVVAISASNTFILPTHQVNALIMRPGGFRTKDYIRAGSGATILFTGILLFCLPLIFEL
jgi:di/tricarboxylate transporter